MARQHPRERGELQEQNGRAEVCPKPNHRPGERAANRMDYKLGAQTLADILQVSLRQAYHMLETGQMPGRKLGNRWLISESEIAEFIASLPSNQPGKPEDAA